MSCRYDDLPDVLSPEDLMGFLRLGRSTVYELLGAGTLPSVRFGRQYRISKRALGVHLGMGGE
jgi:excisionase family DNA binding protein